MTVLQSMMKQEHEHTQPAVGGILGWLGFGRHGDEAEEARAGEPDMVQQARTALMGRIGAFLLDNGLEVTAQNLSTAHSIFARLNPGLKRRIDRLVEEGQPVTQAWLDMATACNDDRDDSAVDKLVDRLERGIADFSRTTASAREATSEYGQALEQHVDVLEKVPDSDSLISDLAKYAKAMLVRSRKAEEELRRSHEEAASLRRNLDRARRDAEVDYLTGLPNRRAFAAVLEKQHREAQLAVEPLSVAFCDIDNFKAVNDSHGHEAGDRIICVVAKTLAQISDDKCHIARHGGEEFVVLFSGCTAQVAAARLDEAREMLANRKLMNRRTQQPFGQVTFSAGVADVFGYPTPNEALAAADAALYAAKQAGRNQIRIA